MSEGALDPREHPFRESVAASYLKGRVEAKRFVDGDMFKVAVGVLPMHGGADHASGRTSELLFGERFMIYETMGDWVWGQSQVDGYVGFARSNGMVPDEGDPSHEITALRIHAYEKPDLKSTPVALLHMTSRVTVTDEADGYFRTDSGGWVPRRHLAPIGEGESDIVVTARRYLHAPYLWGGRSSLGLDCSALIQFALMRNGRSAPRDSDQQERSIGAKIEAGLDGARVGDLLYLKGHVVIMSAPDMVLHANAHHMAVAEEPLDGFLERMRGIGLAVTTVRRP
ncbi:MAG: NlpC/P60 family protein [Alphaproteobacteria bacterium]|nr:NlpC/P60 family protein [Alphaproteobacteria bacterium]